MLSLKELYDIIDKEIFKKNGDDIKKFQTTLKDTLAGDLSSKESLIKEIKEIIPEFVEENDYRSFISQYHINYFQPIYVGTIETISNIINSKILNENSSDEEFLDRLAQIVFQELYGLSVIDEFSYGDINGINEISCNSYTFITMQIYGKKIRIPNLAFQDKKVYEKIVKKSISFDAKSDLKPDCPEILCERITGARVTALMPPYSKEFSLNIRYFSVELITSRDFIELGTSTEEIETTIDNIMPGRPNIIIIGDQGAGKTTYILRLIGSISNERGIVTIEPMFELNPDMYFSTKDIKKLQFLPGLKSAENTFETCLRLNRDLIVNGEIRTAEEASLQLKAWTRQARGSMGSFHTTSILDYMYDFKNLLMQSGTYSSEYSALYDIARATDIVIQLDLDRKKGKRFIREIAEIVLVDDNEKRPFKINTLFKYNKEKQIAEKINKINDSLINRCLQYEFTDKNLEVLKKIGVY